MTGPEVSGKDVPSHVSNMYSKLLEECKSGLKMEERLKARKNDCTEEGRGKAWKVVDEAVKTYSDEMIQRWIAEMDTLLVYAGLFSAVLTAFNVESYSLLSPTAPDPVLAALTQISAQLASFSVHDPFINSTQFAFQPSYVSSDSTAPQRWVIWLNILWFSSLICSLSAAFVAIMVKQWLHEYKSGISGSSRNTAHLRQHRYNGLVQWKLATIIAVLPILLQIASGLFLAGLLVLLWNLNQTVAIVASALVGTLLVFTLATIILPTFTSNCAYLSPLSMALFRSCHLPYSHIRTFIFHTALAVYRRTYSPILHLVSDWLSDVCHGSHPPSVHAMQSAYVTRSPRKLDQDIFVTAYSTTRDLGLLDQTSTCFSDHSIYSLTQFVARIHAQNMDCDGQTASSIHWTHYIPLDMASDMLLVRACSTLGASGETSSQHILGLEHATKAYMYASRVVSGDHRVSCALSNMAALLYNNGDRHPDTFPLSMCFDALKRQIDFVQGTKSTLTDDVRRHVIAAIFTVVSTSNLLSDVFQCTRSIDILASCSSPSISTSQSGDTAEEDTRSLKPLADAIALAEDALSTTLECKEFQGGDSDYKYRTVYFFLQYYRRIGLEQLAMPVLEKMLRALKKADQDIHPLRFGEHDEHWKQDLLRWLKLIEWLKLLAEKKRDKQKAAGKHERAGASSRVV